MSIKTNHSKESLTPESGVLKIQASGAVALPIGPESDRPVVSAAGYLRFDEDIIKPEYFDGTNWQTITNKEYVDARLATSGAGLSDVISNLALDNLTDVTVISPTDGQVLAYDINLGQFRSQTQSLQPITKNFTGDGATLNFDIIIPVSSVNNLVVTINGIQQEPFYSYTLINGNIVSFDEAPELNDRVQVRILKSTVSSDRPRPKITGVAYGQVGQYATITITATDVTYGTGARIGNTQITRIDYTSSNVMQLMIEINQMSNVRWQQPQDLTLVDTSGNEFTFSNLIFYGESKPYWTNSNSYIGSFSGGDTINFTLGVNNATSITIDPAYAGESALPWLSISGNSIVGTAPQNSSPSRYELKVTASNGSVYITKNYWLLVI
ncbi:hypothetical protein UFOVP71_25 [uncultured Caudovirales phage]|uniref:Uncharacterized protein n=1 Tax=uncultured Caudovirales phage TaxID=2100421 RepID=A0A6J5TBZ4_9CAUD|nr:hypothetical protein UFOVP71_25 [uncultured Caudovirales phage]